MTKVLDNSGNVFEERRTQQPWSFDRKIPIGQILFLLFQTGCFIWWLASLNGIIKDHDRRLLIAEAFESRYDSDGRTTADRMGRLEERSIITLQSLQHIENMLEIQQERRVDSAQNDRRK